MAGNAGLTLSARKRTRRTKDKKKDRATIARSFFFLRFHADLPGSVKLIPGVLEGLDRLLKLVFCRQQVAVSQIKIRLRCLALLQLQIRFGIRQLGRLHETVCILVIRLSFYHRILLIQPGCPYGTLGIRVRSFLHRKVFRRGRTCFLEYQIGRK